MTKSMEQYKCHCIANDKIKYMQLKNLMCSRILVGWKSNSPNKKSYDSCECKIILSKKKTHQPKPL